MKDDPYYWYLALTVLCLGFEGIFTLAIKETQEWKFFCPSVFLYLARLVILILIPHFRCANNPINNSLVFVHPFG